MWGRITAAALLVVAENALAATIKIEGGAAPMENIFRRVARPFEQATGITLDLKACGPLDAFKDLADGRTDVAAAGLTFASWMEALQKDGYPVADKPSYKSRIIGRDRIVVITHRGVHATALMRTQLKDVFLGKVASWKALGGPDVPVVIVVGTKVPGTNKTFQEQMLGGKELTRQGVREVTDAAAVAAAVASTPGAIGFGPAGMTGDFDTPKTPDVSRPITTATRGVPSDDVVKLIDFIKNEGSKYTVH